MGRLPALVIACCLVAASCGGDDASSDATLDPLVSTADSTSTTLTPTTVAPTTTASTTTTVAATTTTTVAATTTTRPPGARLVMTGDRLGLALIGSSAEAAIDYITRVIGAPADDQGWQSVRDVGLPCPGTRVRFVTWGDGLTVFFSDESNAASGVDHLAAYTYAVSETMSPAGLRTPGGVVLGSTVGALTDSDAGIVLNSDDVFGLTARTSDGLLVGLSGPHDDDLVVSFSAGEGCGE